MGGMTLVVLARNGDILNCLPIAYAFHKRGGKVRWLVSHEYAPILEGVSYVDAEIWKGSQDTLLRAMTYVRSCGRRAMVPQAWKNPDLIMDPNRSFTLEQWRLAGMQQHFGKFPLVIDQRSENRERELVIRHIEFAGPDLPACGKPIILVATTGVSSPYKYADKLIATLRGLDAEIIDMDNVRATRVYDLLGLYERADCLVSVDTMHHHLARASYLPVVLLQNDGWQGSYPVPQVRASWRYAEGDVLSQVKERTEEIISRRCSSLQVVVNTYPKGHCDRHARAMATHPKDTIHAQFDSPRLKELLALGLQTKKDGTVFTNDDVTFSPDTLSRIQAHLAKWDFGCSRRPRDPVHIGREIFFFRSDWLREHLDDLPDPYWYAHRSDLILCKWLRSQLGIPTTHENLNYDMAPVELPDLITHEDHKSSWQLHSKESVLNDELWMSLK